MFKRKWHWALGSFIFIGLASVAFLRPTIPSESIKVYRAVTPAPKPVPIIETKTEKTDIAEQHGHEHDHGHGHPHETVPHDHAAETNNNNGEHDWRDDSAFDVPLLTGNPWEQSHPMSESTDAADDTYPPQNWYKTKDPELYVEYHRALLVRKFGDIPQVRAFTEIELKIRSGINPTRDEFIRFLEAQYYLWPDERTLKSLQYHREQKRQDH